MRNASGKSAWMAEAIRGRWESFKGMEAWKGAIKWNTPQGATEGYKGFRGERKVLKGNQAIS